MNTSRASRGPKGPKGRDARLGGKYVLGDEIGRGGMGVVYAGEHRLLAQPVAIKFLRPELAAKPDAMARFLREARAAASLRGPHAVRIFDVDRSDDGAPYMVMERLEGEPLDALLDRCKRLPVVEAVDRVLEACEAVAEAHALGIVHRDLKPQNLFVTEAPDGSRHVKVLDFGISKSLADADAPGGRSLTGPNAPLGSPEYMSPEQVRNAGSVDARTDLWSLGVILYELLTGRVPFEGESPPHVMALILSAPTPLLRSARADAPEPLEAAVARCLERDVERRPADVAELAALLAPFGGPGAAAAAERVRRALGTGPRSVPRPGLTRSSNPPPGGDPADAKRWPTTGAELETLSAPAAVAVRRSPLAVTAGVVALVTGVAWVGWRAQRPGGALAPAAVAPVLAAPAPAPDPSPRAPSTAASPPDASGPGAPATVEASPGTAGAPSPVTEPTTGPARASGAVADGGPNGRPRPPPRPAARAASPPRAPAPSAPVVPRSLDDIGLLP